MSEQTDIRPSPGRPLQAVAPTLFVREGWKQKSATASKRTSPIRPNAVDHARFCGCQERTRVLLLDQSSYMRSCLREGATSVQASSETSGRDGWRAWRSALHPSICRTEVLSCLQCCHRLSRSRYLPLIVCNCTGMMSQAGQARFVLRVTYVVSRIQNIQPTQRRMDFPIPLRHCFY